MTALSQTITDPRALEEFEAWKAGQGRICVDCGGKVSAQSKGRCRSCGAKAMSANAEVVARRNASIRARNIARKQSPGGWNRKPLPADFAEVATNTATAALCQRYEVSKEVIRRWRKLSGVELPSRKRPEPCAVAKPQHNVVVKRPATRSSSRAPVGRKNTRAATDMLVIKQNSAVVQQQTRNMRVPPPDRSTIEARAAEVLRRLVATYRCDADGRFDPRGTFWRHGNVVLTVDEMLRRAERHGWSEAA